MRLFRKRKNCMSMTIISGKDGPTSVFIAGKQNGHKPGLQERMRKKRYQRKCARITARLPAAPHTLNQVIDYIKNKYYAKELPADCHAYTENRNALKASLIRKYRPHLAGPPPAPLLQGKNPQDLTENEIAEYLEQSRLYSERLAGIPDKLFPMDYHYYVISVPKTGKVDVTIEKRHQALSVGYQCKGGREKKLKKITKDIYWYYGVTREDIRDKTPRLKQLVTMLASLHR